jgi:hypothetical protein
MKSSFAKNNHCSSSIFVLIKSNAALASSVQTGLCALSSCCTENFHDGITDSTVVLDVVVEVFDQADEGLQLLDGFASGN